MGHRPERSGVRSAWESNLGAFGNALLEAAGGAGIGVVVTLVDGEAPLNVFVSDGIVTIFGRSREVLLDRSPFDFIAPADSERIRARFAERHRGDHQSLRYELSIVHGDGRIVPIEISIGDVTFDGRRATVAFVTDITQRRLAADAARKGEATFRALIEAVPEAIGIMRGNRFLYANAAYVRLLGYDSAEALFATPLDQLVHPEDVAMQRSREARMLQGGQPLPPQLYRGVRRDGSRVEIEVTSVPFEYEGKPAILGIGRDVTERRRMETQLLQADRLAALGTLAAGVAHEVNNPLAYLSLNLEWLARQLPELARDPDRLPALALMLVEARHGANRVASIVRDLRAFSRADAETRGPVDLGAAIASATKMAAHDIRHHAAVATAVEDDLPPAWANDARLEQVLLNLLLNAVQAMDETTADQNEIKVTARRGEPERVIIEVTDNGPGIPPETARRIFDPFFTTKAVGTGLGLSICHSIVTSFGGRISVQSRLGEGSTFRIDLPTRPNVADSTRPPPEGAAGDAAPLRRARVLVVDDEVAIANTLRELLQQDHDVVAVITAIDALDRVCAGGQFDVVLCDLMMPQMSGMELYERLREHSPGLENRIVFMTGGAFTARAAEFLARVPNRRIEKPFTLTAIEEIVRAMAGRAAAQEREAP